MNRIFTLFALLSAITLFGQSERVILVEQFTQASCGPCAGTNPVIFPILEENNDKAAVIAYQVSWPGFDPMHEQNPGEVNARVSYYGVRGVPGTAFNGDYDRSRSSLNTVTQSTINSASATPSPMDLDLQVDPFVNFKGLDITLNIEASQDVSGSLVAHIVVVEDEIKFSSPPGSNGETDFRWVMKKMLPNSRGTDLESNWNVGQTASIDFSYEFENFYDWKNAGVVAFIQDNNSKDVLQAVYWQPNFEPNDGDDVLVTGAAASGYLDAEVDIVCGGQASPVVTIMNSGTSSLTSCIIEYDVNGSTSSSYTWTGNLGTFEETQVQLPEISFPIQLIGEMNVDVKQPNGVEDLYPENGRLFTEFLPAPNTTTEATFEIRPILRPGDVSFQISNSSGAVILEDGPFTQRTTMSYDITLDENECYTIEVFNNYNSVNGTYYLKDKDGNTVLSETIFGTETHVSDFGSFASVSTDDVAGVADWFLMPNPASNAVTVELELQQSKSLDLVITDLLGNVVVTQRINGAVGLHSKLVDISDMNSGIYFVSLRDGESLETRRLVKK